MEKPTVPEVLPIVNALYARNNVGCCWHIVLDDGNYERHNVAWCVDYIRSVGCAGAECAQLAELLPRMTTTQLRKLSKEHD